jgi:flavin reductase (DIM6/NTAB) family NADH-FMN oxidoreductase RutF
MSATDIREAFRLAMRRVAATVAIVSARCEGERHGTTATSVTSISLDPPSVLVCFNQASRLHEFLHKQDHFCVNILQTANIEIAKIFSSAPAAERFAVGDWRDSEGIPYLADAQANLFCRKEQEITYGSHTIFIGRVLQAVMREEVSPLLYHDGRYSTVAPDAVSAKYN